MITRIEANRYRCFERLNVALGGYTVLVGRNGAGKTTLVDIPVLLGEMLQKQSTQAAFFGPTPSHTRPRADGALDLVFNRSGSWFALAVEVALPEDICSKAGARFARYELGFTIEESALTLSQEAVILFDDPDVRDEFPEGLWSSSISQTDTLARIVLRRERDGRTEFFREPKLRGPKPPSLPFDSGREAPALSFVPPDPDRFSACNWLRSFLSRDCTMYQPSLVGLRTAQPSPGREFQIASDASTLAWSILRFAVDNPRGYKEWNQHIQSVLPIFESVEARQREDDQFAYLRVHYKNGLVVHGHGLSDGTLSVLALTILPYLPNVPRYLAIEEPENGIHPKAIEAILEMLQAIDNSEVWVTSHSPIVVAVTPLKNLLCLSVGENGGVGVTRGTDHPFLGHWQGTPDLGTLFSAGVL